MTTAGPARILPLPERLADQIAAGEVVERPASVLKELLENSIDAGARRISVDIENGGARLIRVRDDGTGIHRDDLRLALDRHATSKIATLEDLVNVATLGFRGEALPSIASVSRLELSSRVEGAENGWKLVDGPKREAAGDAALEPLSHPVGTTVSVKDLFYNTPARRKFMRTEKTEYRHLEDVFKRAALSRFDCAFTLSHNGRDVHVLPVATSEAERARRVAKLCGSAFMERALALAFEAEGLRLDGWIGAPGYTRGVSDLQYFFVNGRMVRDNLLRHAVRHAHDAIVESGRQPAYVLSLHLHPEQADVNVHPSKHEVRFRDGRSVHHFIARSVRQALQTSGSDSDARAPFVDEAGAAPASLPRAGATRVREQMSAYDALRDHGARAATLTDKPLGEALEQIERRYIVARNADGLVLVDARRGCQRVAAERLMTALAGDGPGARPLLVPVAVAVREQQAERVERHAEALERLGFDLRRIALDTISCRAVPAPLAGVAAAELVPIVADALVADSCDDSLRSPALSQVAAQELPTVLAAVLEHCDLTAAWSWERAALDELLRSLEGIEGASHTRAGEVIWRELNGDDIAALLNAGRRVDGDAIPT